jgi:pimeloyl-ACP methyl ester carboxylesterase
MLNNYIRMKRIFLLITILITLASCQKEKITIGIHVSETFYVDNTGASMRVLVEGNTASQVFLIFVHGGPGTSSYGYHTDYISQNIEDKYACVYWDQRDAGASQGNSNGASLNLTQMTEDLKKVIQVLKKRYGQNSGVFILGHSFGGLLTASFMTTADYQSMVKGWIFLDGSHNYPLNDTVTRQMLLTVGLQQIALNKNIEKWNPIIDYCNTHTGNFTLEESDQFGTYAYDAETYFDEVKKLDFMELIKEYALKDHLPITSALINSIYSSNAAFIKDLAKTEFTSSLYKVVTPTLLLFGQYDFICPKELGEDVYNHISTTEKRIAISPISGHNMYIQDASFFCNEVNTFIEQYKK